VIDVFQPQAGETVTLPFDHIVNTALRGFLALPPKTYTVTFRFHQSTNPGLSVEIIYPVCGAKCRTNSLFLRYSDGINFRTSPILPEKYKRCVSHNQSIDGNAAIYFYLLGVDPVCCRCYSNLQTLDGDVAESRLFVERAFQWLYDELVVVGGGFRLSQGRTEYRVANRVLLFDLAGTRLMATRVEIHHSSYTPKEVKVCDIIVQYPVTTVTTEYFEGYTNPPEPYITNADFRDHGTEDAFRQLGE
jgi:hypothetical protein